MVVGDVPFAMSGSHQAVFLSYASQDADAAEQLCRALRAAGIEVWFDRNELVGGDQWDIKIRRQISECALFVPIISANTQARLEGYFRLEWKLAALRTHAMAEEKAFLLPIVIDATPDAGAKVPGEFRAVQWTKLEGGRATPAFVQRVRALLASDEIDAPPPTTASVSRNQPNARSAGPRRLPWVLAVLAAVAIAAFLMWRKGTLGTASPASTSLQAVPTSAPSDKSVAVLAFANVSNDAENEYLSDGISDELLTVLQKIPGLHVAARTSAFSFKGKTATAQEIGAKLHVAHLVEGSVQKVGSRVKVMARMSRVATGEEEWTKSYPARELNDVFALQEEIAQAILGEIRSAFEGRDPDRVGELVRAASLGRTQNPEAHKLYMQGSFYYARRDPPNVKRGLDYFQRATASDPRFALAWARVAACHIWLARFDETNLDFNAIFARARQAAVQALALEPDLAEAHSALSAIETCNGWNWKIAEAEGRRAIAAAPGDSDILGEQVSVELSMGRGTKAVEWAREALAADPINAGSHLTLCFALLWNNRPAEGEAAARQLLEISPTASMARGLLSLSLLLQRRFPEALEAASSAEAEWERLTYVALAQAALGHPAEADAAQRLLQERCADYAGYQLAQVCAARGDIAGAFSWLDRSFAKRDSAMGLMKLDPLFEKLHDDPRWPQMLRKVGLADDQLK